MVQSKLDEHFRAIWYRALNTSSLEALTPELVKSWADDRSINYTHIEEREVGSFTKIPAVVLKVGEFEAYFPKLRTKDNPAWELRRRKVEENALLWESVEWFCPLWISIMESEKITDSLRGRSKKSAIELFNYHTSTLYTIPFQTICIAQILPRSRSLKEFSPLAREAFLAFYSGYRASSISALIPAIEGGLTRIISGTDSNLATSSKIDRVFNRAIETASKIHYQGAWVPQEYLDKNYLFVQDECVFVFETFRRWLENSFFRKTGEYDGATWLNRHIFAHGANAEWQQSANFTRIIVALATLAFVESWHDETHIISSIFPSMNDDSKLLWQQALFRANAQMNLNIIEHQRYQKEGRLVPEMPTDNGVTLRAAILSDDCIKDVVRPLRKAGWHIEMEEPDDCALYTTVTASAGNEKFIVALLYSCATDNAIYRRLAKKSHAILYRGTPYKQTQYAYGINVYVGPVAGWRPPLVRSGRSIGLFSTALRSIIRIKSLPNLGVKMIKLIASVWYRLKNLK